MKYDVYKYYHPVLLRKQYFFFKLLTLRDDLDQCPHFTLKKKTTQEEQNINRQISGKKNKKGIEKRYTTKGKVLGKSLTSLKNHQNSDYYTISKRYMCSYVHCGIIHNIQNMETT